MLFSFPAFFPLLLFVDAHPSGKKVPHNGPATGPHTGPNTPPRTLPLQRLPSREFSPSLSEKQAWLLDQAAVLQHKYAPELDEEWKKYIGINKKRDVGTAQLTNVDYDGWYLGAVNIGTPPQELLLVLDTGSADLWAAGAACGSCGNGERFDPTASSTYQQTDGAFAIAYGSGSVSGNLGTDVVELAGFSLPNISFSIANQASNGLISAPVSGIMGLAFQNVSTSKKATWWETLATSGRWDSPELGVSMARFRGNNSASRVETDGGYITFGGVDRTKFVGELNYVSIDSSARDYWRIPVEHLTVNGNFVNISQPQAAIDTGTTLIGAPPSAVQAIFAQIPGSQPLDASIAGTGYWQYPCNATVPVVFQFGGEKYEMSNQDMNLGSYTSDSSMCTGAFFEQQMSSSSPIQWIVGASFLKNVYTSFRNDPTAIGFAPLNAQ
ncbi:hypothetical protein L202_01820 [Cryptococcus amylolentus CBS 6039]|uniref:Peptidase A1 domain-containing protein n=1 Tax=Cryptococcus amylolentus CBS 6039 TaxID=1295533 RepID=A0A1E3I5C0_9TREE|nr:hypothetical protein L202_01820 [Cryptococcus amylolentus CBS 6039]ODN83728.1 hypothetical protein L202_01820 [Cryptococcus amylolentus CBS 6039]